MQVLDATRDVTEKDLVRRKYEQLRSEQIEWQAKKQIKKRKLFWIW